jgi:serine/threonine protein phosphatase 1
MRIVIGDIHGCYKTFRNLLEDKIKISRSDTVYLVGDYIDRGPGSKDVLDYILKLLDDGYDIQPIRGNHEEMLADAYNNQSQENFMLWMMNGAEDTLLSYGIESYTKMGRACLNELPEFHISFIRQLPYYIELDDFIIVHAGINYEASNPYQDTRSMVWCRDCTNDLEKSGGRVIIHGHTPIPLSEIENNEADKKSRQINTDAGCVYKGMPAMGNLVGLDLDSYKVYSLENIDF